MSANPPKIGPNNIKGRDNTSNVSLSYPVSVANRHTANAASFSSMTTPIQQLSISSSIKGFLDAFRAMIEIFTFSAKDRELETYALLGKLAQLLEAMVQAEGPIGFLAAQVRNSLFHGDPKDIDPHGSSNPKNAINKIRKFIAMNLDLLGIDWNNEENLNNTILPEDFVELAFYPRVYIDNEKPNYANLTVLQAYKLIRTFDKEKAEEERLKIPKPNTKVCEARYQLYFAKHASFTTQKKRDNSNDLILEAAIGYLEGLMGSYAQYILEDDTNYKGFLRRYSGCKEFIQKGRAFRHNHQHLFTTLDNKQTQRNVASYTKALATSKAMQPKVKSQTTASQQPNDASSIQTNTALSHPNSKGKQCNEIVELKARTTAANATKDQFSKATTKASLAQTEFQYGDEFDLQDFADVANNTEVLDRNGKYALLWQKIKQLEEQIGEIPHTRQAAIDRVKKEAAKEIETLRNATAARSAEIELERKEHADEQNILTALKTEVANKKRELEELTKKNKERKAGQNESQHTDEQLKVVKNATMAELAKQIANLEKQNKELRAQIESLTKSNEFLKITLGPQAATINSSGTELQQKTRRKKKKNKKGKATPSTGPSSSPLLSAAESENTAVAAASIEKKSKSLILSHYENTSQQKDKKDTPSNAPSVNVSASASTAADSNATLINSISKKSHSSHH